MKQEEQNNDQNKLPKVTVTARNIDTKKIICQGTDGSEVIKTAEDSGENYILDFDSELRHNFLF